MGYEENLLNPVAGSVQNLMPMKETDLKFLNSYEDQWRYSPTKSIAAYYPVKLLPSVRINMDSKTPIIMSAGTIVSIIPLKDQLAYTANDTSIGVVYEAGVGGKVATSKLVDGTVAYQPLNAFYAKSVSGLFTVANGSGASVNDAYTDMDGVVGLLDTTGGVVSSASSAYARAANIPFGVVGQTVYGDLRGRWLNFDFQSPQYTIFRDGTMTVPYVLMYALTADAAKNTAAVAALNKALVPYHQFFMAADSSSATLATSKSAVEALIAPGAYVKPTAYGKMTNWLAADNVNQKVGVVLETRNRVPYGMDEMIDSFPGSGIQGMDTGGLPTRLYHFIQTALGVIAPTKASNKAAIKDALVNPVAGEGAYANVNFEFGQIDVELGFNR